MILLNNYKYNSNPRFCLLSPMYAVNITVIKITLKAKALIFPSLRPFISRGSNNTCVRIPGQFSETERILDNEFCEFISETKAFLILQDFQSVYRDVSSRDGATPKYRLNSLEK